MSTIMVIMTDRRKATGVGRELSGTGHLVSYTGVLCVSNHDDNDYQEKGHRCGERAVRYRSFGQLHRCACVLAITKIMISGEKATHVRSKLPYPSALHMCACINTHDDDYSH